MKEDRVWDSDLSGQSSLVSARAECQEGLMLASTAAKDRAASEPANQLILVRDCGPLVHQWNKSTAIQGAETAGVAVALGRVASQMRLTWPAAPRGPANHIIAIEATGFQLHQAPYR